MEKLENMNCDFCYTPTTETEGVTYRVEKYTTKLAEAALLNDLKLEINAVDDGRWLACLECAQMIDNSQWTKLEDRSLKTDPLTSALPDKEREEFRSLLREYWLSFRLHRLT
jgi:hypothetical protein